MKASSRGKLTVLGLVLAAVLFVSINIASNNSFRALQVDLTEGKLFTLSGETSKVLAEIDEPITMRLYFSKVMGEQSPAHLTYFERVRELLEQYVKLANGKLRLQVFNPEPFSDDEDSAVAFGLSGLPSTSKGIWDTLALLGRTRPMTTRSFPFSRPSARPF